MTDEARASAAAVGVLGGTFDPVHVGHLSIAEQVRRRLALDRVLMLPTAVPPHKPLQKLSPISRRLEMLRLALAGCPGLEICEREAQPGRVCYTVDTLRALRDEAPGCRPVFILGMDSLLQIETWRDASGLLREFDVVVFDRPEDAAGDATRTLAPEIVARLVSLDEDAPAASELDPGRGGRIFHLALPPIPVSSSQVRACAAKGGDLHGLVPPAVAGYIHRSGLYRREGAELSRQTPEEIPCSVEAAQDKKAEGLLVLDLRGLSDVTDFFIICHGTSDRQVVAIVDHIEDQLRAIGRKPSHIEGKREGQWVLMDYVDFVVHVFVEDKRRFYGLERLWGDAPQVDIVGSA